MSSSRRESDRAFQTATFWLSALSAACFLLALVLRLIDPPEAMSLPTPDTGSGLLDDFLAEPVDDNAPAPWSLAVAAGLALVASWCYRMRSRNGRAIALLVAAAATGCLVFIAVTMTFVGNLIITAAAGLACVALLLSAASSIRVPRKPERV